MCWPDVVTLCDVATTPGTSWPVATLKLTVVTFLGRPLAVGAADVVTLAIMSRHQTKGYNSFE